MKLIPLQFQLYILMFVLSGISFIAAKSHIYLIGVLITIGLMILLIQQIDKEFLLIETILRTLKGKGNRLKIQTNTFNFIEIQKIAAHLNDIIEIHQKTLKKASFYNNSKKEKNILSSTINIDELTGLYKRNKFVEDSEKAFRKSVLTNENNFFVAFLDIDHFKNVNDTYGHDIGDKVLIDFSQIIKENTIHSRNGEQSMACRWGGEEFIVMYFGYEKKDITILLNKLRVQVEKHYFPEVEHITVSIGYSQINVKNENESLDILIKKADQGVYEAKDNGRNQIKFIKELTS